MKSRRFAAILALSTIAIAVVLPSCSRATAPLAIPEGPWAAEFAAAAERAKSDFVRDALADGEVTDAEFAEARSRFVSCMSDAGFSVAFTVNQGNWSYGGSSAQAETQEFRAADRDCYDQWIGDIWNLYTSPRTDPDNEGWDTLVARCLVDRGLVPAGFTARAWLEFLTDTPEQPMECVTHEDGSEICTALDPFFRDTRMLPGGLASMDDPEALNCQTDPTGIAVE